jgi:hypothetical protein
MSEETQNPQATQAATSSQQPAERPKPSAVLATKLDTAGAIKPTTMGEMIEYAKMIATSGLVPKDYIDNAGAVIVAIQMGAELGLSPMAALQNISVINGRPAVWGDAGLAIVQTHAEFVEMKETSGPGWAECTLTRRGRLPVTRRFTLEHAREAQLLNKPGPWQTYRERMLQMRARWWAMRDLFADALKGIYGAEEASDMTPTPPQLIEQLTTLAAAPPPKPKTLNDVVAIDRAVKLAGEDPCEPAQKALDLPPTNEAPPPTDADAPVQVNAKPAAYARRRRQQVE